LEGTRPSGAASHDKIFGDATTHQPLKNPNNTGNQVLVGASTTAATSGHCAQFAANGHDITDAGAACGTGGGGSGYTNVTGSVSETTVAQINSAGVSGTYYATTPLSIATGGTITVNVQFSKAGLWTIASGQTVRFAQPYTETDGPNQHFTGSGVVVLAAQDAWVEAWGAVGYSSQASAVSGTDSNAAIQACITAMTAGQCKLQALYYKNASTALSIEKSNVGIEGTSLFGLGYGGSVTPSAIVTTSASADIIDVAGASAVTQIYGVKITTLLLNRSTTPSGTATGLSASFCQNCVIKNVNVQDSIRGYYLKSFGADVGTGAVSENWAGWGFNGVTVSAGNVYGFYLDAATATELSLVMRQNSVSSNTTTPTSYAVYLSGGASSTDVMADAFQTFQTNYVHWNNHYSDHRVYSMCSSEFGGGFKWNWISVRLEWWIRRLDEYHWIDYLHGMHDHERRVRGNWHSKRYHGSLNPKRI